MPKYLILDSCLYVIAGKSGLFDGYICNKVGSPGGLSLPAGKADNLRVSEAEAIHSFPEFFI